MAGRNYVGIETRQYFMEWKELFWNRNPSMAISGIILSTIGKKLNIQYVLNFGEFCTIL
jgi:hypothetical protein